MDDLLKEIHQCALRSNCFHFVYFFSFIRLRNDIIVSAQGQRTHSGLDNRDLFVGQFKIAVQILVYPLLLEIHHRNKHEIGFGYVGRGISHSHHEPRELAGHKISKVDSFQLRIQETDIQIGECVHRSRPENLRCRLWDGILFRTAHPKADAVAIEDFGVTQITFSA